MPKDRLSESKYFQIDVLNRISALEMRARDLVEGTLAGLQRSPYIGVSAEFAQHRGYVFGDDTRHIDWKVFARTERFYVREFQEETNFVVTFVVDTSESMRYGDPGKTKLDYACLLSTALAYLVLRQSDAVSLALFDQNLITYLPPRTGLANLSPFMNRMETTAPKGNTRIGGVLNLLAEQLSRRGIVILLSDLLDDPEGIVRGIQRLRFAKHEVTVLHVMEPRELTFEFEGRIRFVGMEGLPQATVDARQIQADYLSIVHDFIHRMRQACTNAHADYALANTGEGADRLLIRYLTSRGKTREGRR